MRFATVVRGTGGLDEILGIGFPLAGRVGGLVSIDKD
jgi:hypothetical protein